MRLLGRPTWFKFEDNIGRFWVNSPNLNIAFNKAREKCADYGGDQTTLKLIGYSKR